MAWRMEPSQVSRPGVELQIITAVASDSDGKQMGTYQTSSKSQIIRVMIVAADLDVLKSSWGPSKVDKS